MNIEIVPIGGSYYRVADPDWSDPLDPSFASIDPGQRWNPPGILCLYLNADVTTAHATVKRQFIGLPYGPEDMDTATGPLLVETQVPEGQAVDALTDVGLAAVGLPTSYPYDGQGDLISHAACQPVGQAALVAGLDGVDCRSAAIGGLRELAWFPRETPAQETKRLAFDEWW